MIAWFPHHTLTDGATERVDGYLEAAGRRLQLDVASFGDECCVTEADRVDALAAWATGRVHLSQDLERHGVPTLVVPMPALTQDLVDEALRRYRP